MLFIHDLHLYINSASLFGLTLLLGLICGEIATRCYFLPRISGYIFVGFLAGPNAFNIMSPSLLSNTRFFIDISLGLILFGVGKHLDFRWLRNDRSLLSMATSEALLTFLFVFILFYIFHFPWLQAALAATIAMATSPAVVMSVANDLQSKGPVTRRTFILTSLNNLIALVFFIILLPLTQSNISIYLIGKVTYCLLGSIFLGISIFILALITAYFVGKRKENHFVLFIGCIMLGIGLANILNFSIMLTLFTFGVAVRNFNYKYLLMEIDFGWLGKLSFILLFVITGIHLQIKGLWEATLIVVGFLLIRSVAKSLGIWLFAKSSQLTKQQTWSLCFALTPMAGLAVGMSNIIFDINPKFSIELMTIIATSIAVLNILGPIAVQIAFINSKEVIIENKLRN